MSRGRERYTPSEFEAEAESPGLASRRWECSLLSSALLR